MASIAGFVAKHGTPEETLLIELDKISCSTVASKIRDRQFRERVVTILSTVKANPGVHTRKLVATLGEDVRTEMQVMKMELRSEGGHWHLTERGEKRLAEYIAIDAPAYAKTASAPSS